LLFEKVPFIDEDDDAFPFFYRQAENIEVLRGDPLRCIEHQQADIRFIHGLDGTDYRIELEVFMYLGLTPDAGRIDQDEIFPEQVVSGMDRIPCGAGDIANDGTFLSNERV